VYRNVTPLELRMSSRCRFLGFVVPFSSLSWLVALCFETDLYTEAMVGPAGVLAQARINSNKKSSWNKK
jgi:hypothetical protein